MIVPDTNVISELMRSQPHRAVVAWVAAQPDALFAEEFAGRILPFAGTAARRYADIVVLRRHAGKQIEAFDALIAATAWVAGAAVATRDVEGFSGCGLTIVNPWEAA